MNKKISIFLILLISILFSFGFAQEEKTSEGGKIVDAMKFDKIKLNIPQIGKDVEKYILPNGMVCLIKEDRSLPVIDINVLVKAAEAYERPDKCGTAYLCAKNLVSGGTKKYLPDEIEKEIDYRSIIINFGVNPDYTYGSLNVLSKDFEVAFKIFSDMLINPAFDKDKLEVEKMKFINYVARQKDNPSFFSRMEFGKFVYGNHPYGRIYEKDIINKITNQDLKSWYNEYFYPNNAIMTISGDFDKAQIKNKIIEAFGNWEKTDIKLPQIPDAVEADKKECLIINKELPQAFINMGNLGIKKGNPDIHSLIVMNQIFGGGSLTSWLNMELRAKRGLTYGAFSAFTARGYARGLFNLTLSTKSASAGEALGLILKMIDKLRQEQVTDKELKQAKNSEINNFVFGLTPTDEMLLNLAVLEFYNLPRDFYVNYIKNVEKTTKEDILRCARTYLHPEKIQVVIVGNVKEIKPEVEKIIPVAAGL